MWCERRFGGMFRDAGGEEGNFLPEYGNSWSALCIGCSGLHMMLFWDSSSPLLRLVQALFVVNSWSSFLFHHYDRLGNVDGDSMVMASLLLSGYVADEFIRATAYRLKHGTSAARKLWRLCTGIMWIVLATFFWWFVGDAPAEDEKTVKGDVFEFAFAIPIVLTAVLSFITGVLWRRPWYKNEYICPRVQTTVLRYFYAGLIMCAIGFGCWYLSETQCGSSRFFILFPGHAIWHVLMPWGCQMMMVLPSVMTAEMEKTYPIFRNGLYFSMFPAYDMSLDPDMHKEIYQTAFGQDLKVVAQSTNKTLLAHSIMVACRIQSHLELAMSAPLPPKDAKSDVQSPRSPMAGRATSLRKRSEGGV